MLPPPKRKERAIQMQRRFKPETVTLQDRISEWAVGVRELASNMPPGPDRDELLIKLKQAETAMHLQDWANSPGSRSPK